MMYFCRLPNLKMISETAADAAAAFLLLEFESFPVNFCDFIVVWKCTIKFSIRSVDDDTLDLLYAVRFLVVCFACETL